jgi:hypothetical protein
MGLLFPNILGNLWILRDLGDRGRDLWARRGAEKEGFHVDRDDLEGQWRRLTRHISSGHASPHPELSFGRSANQAIIIVTILNPFLGALKLSC